MPQLQLQRGGGGGGDGGGGDGGMHNRMGGGGGDGGGGGGGGVCDVRVAYLAGARRRVEVARARARHADAEAAWHAALPRRTARARCQRGVNFVGLVLPPWAAFAWLWTLGARLDAGDGGVSWCAGGCTHCWVRATRW